MGRKRVENPKYGQCTDAEKTRPHTLYRMYDEAGTLLYIGVTGEDISQRIYMHLQTTVMVESWRIFMCYESHTTETYPNKIAARAPSPRIDDSGSTRSHTRTLRRMSPKVTAPPSRTCPRDP